MQYLPFDSYSLSRLRTDRDNYATLSMPVFLFRSPSFLSRNSSTMMYCARVQTSYQITLVRAINARACESTD